MLVQQSTDKKSPATKQICRNVEILRKSILKTTFNNVVDYIRKHKPNSATLMLQDFLAYMNSRRRKPFQEFNKLGNPELFAYAFIETLNDSFKCYMKSVSGLVPPELMSDSIDSWCKKIGLDYEIDICYLNRLIETVELNS